MFPTKQRVPREIFKKAMTEGARYSSGLFLLKRAENGLNYGRFGVVISKKVSKLAVRRNKIKRFFVNSVKENSDNFSNFDYIFIVSPNCVEKNYQEINEEVKRISF